ncbi:MAG TPA: metallophosphoesterase [Mucilaginibacter sp.]|jgi:hypothetical protein
MKFKPRPAPSATAHFKLQRQFGDVISPLKPHPTFNPIPVEHQKPSILTYDLSDALHPDEIQTITGAGKIVFHCAGDTGGINGEETQEELARQMTDQVNEAAAGDAPAFFYHLGDVVYFNGLVGDYPQQFYDPYKSYPRHIFAIAGNHDGETKVQKGDEPDNEPSLTGFFANFCTKFRDFAKNSPYRHTMDQPWPYWTLDAPFITIIGLYSNVDGSLDDTRVKTHNQDQYNWFVAELKKADPNKCLMLAVHHPPYSMDTAHGGYQDILDAIDQASEQAGRSPDAVFTGHVHNYQRFTRSIGGKDYPYIIAGAAGYANSPRSMHKLQKNPAGTPIPNNFKTNQPGVVLARYNTQLPGFLRITVDANHFKGVYFTGTFEGPADAAHPVNTIGGDHAPATLFDSFTLNWRTHKLT